MKTRTIGIYGEVADAFYERAVAGVLRYCISTGGLHVRDFRMRAMIEDMDRRPPPWKGRVDAVVVGIGVLDWPARSIADWVVSGGVPAVSVGHDWFDPRVPAFYVDQTFIADQAAQHLVDCDCASFLFYGFAKSTGSSVRGQAFLQALAARKRRGVAHAAQTQYYGAFEDEAKTKTDPRFAELLKMARKPVGVFALNDNFAVAAAMICRDLGLDIPQSVRVLGAEDTLVARSNDPPLSSIRTSREQAGYEAMAALHRMLKGEPGPTSATAVRGATVVPRVSTVGAQDAVGSVDDLRRYIEEHACDGANVEQLVDIVGISRRSFENWFREHFGHSPGHEIQRVRLEKAKELLAGSDLSVTRIASMVGFQEAAAFSRFFRAGTGLSPRQFREQQTGK